MSGLDIAWAMRKRQAATRDPALPYVEIADRLALSSSAVRAGRAALQAGAPVLCDCEMVGAGIIRRHLAAGHDSLVPLTEAAVPDPAGFWDEQGQRVDWIKPYTKVKNPSFAPGEIDIKWYEDGTLNVSANCIDRHLETRADQTAIIWEPDDPEEDAQHITYAELHRRTCRMANILEDLGVRKGDRVVIYLPMIPEAAYAMLACARVGAVHSGVFGGFSPDSLAGRIIDCDSNIVITADEGVRGGRSIPLKKNVDAAAAIPGCDILKTVLVVKRTCGDINWVEGRDHWYHEASADQG